MKVDGHKVTQEDVSKHVRGGNQLSTKVKLTVERHGSGNIEEVVCMRAPSVFVEHTKVSESRKCPFSSAGHCFVGGGFFGPPQIWRAHARGAACGTNGVSLFNQCQNENLYWSSEPHVYVGLSMYLCAGSSCVCSVVGA